jgi:hypothetical protein
MIAFWEGVSMRRPEGGPFLRGADAADEEGSMVHALRDVTVPWVFLDYWLRKKKREKEREEKGNDSKQERGTLKRRKAEVRCGRGGD